MLLALGSGLVYGVSDYLGGRVSRRLPPVVVTLIAELTLFAVTLAGVPLIESTGPSPRAIWWGVVGGIAGSAGVLGLYLALSRGHMTVVAPITGVVAAAVPVMVGVALGERPGLLAGAGIVVALVAVMLIGGISGSRTSLRQRSAWLRSSVWHSACCSWRIRAPATMPGSGHC